MDNRDPCAWGNPDERMSAKIWEEIIPSGDVLIDREIPAVSSLSLAQGQSISDGQML